MGNEPGKHQAARRVASRGDSRDDPRRASYASRGDGASDKSLKKAASSAASEASDVSLGSDLSRMSLGQMPTADSRRASFAASHGGDGSDRSLDSHPTPSTPSRGGPLLPLRESKSLPSTWGGRPRAGPRRSLTPPPGSGRRRPAQRRSSGGESAAVERNRRITAARDAATIHGIVRDGSLTMVNAATAVTRLARVGDADFAAAAPWAALRAAVADHAAAFRAREAANALHGYAKLARAGLARDAVPLAELGAAAAREAPAMDAQAAANALWALATLGRRASLALGALDAAARRTAPRMDAQHVANALFAFAALGREPTPATRHALEAAASREAPRMKPQEVANGVETNH